MPKITISELKDELERTRKIVEYQNDNISELNKKIEEMQHDKNVVDISDFMRLKQDYELLENKYKELSRLYEHEKAKKKEKDSRGAGRKEYTNYPVIKRIYSLYLDDHLSLKEIADTLNAEQIPTKRGGTWSKSSVRFILLNQKYNLDGIISDKDYKLISERLKRINP